MTDSGSPPSNLAATHTAVEWVRRGTNALRLELPEAVWMDYAPGVLRLCSEIERLRAEVASLRAALRVARDALTMTPASLKVGSKVRLAALDAINDALAAPTGEQSE